MSYRRNTSIDAIRPQTLKISMDAQRFEPLRRMAMYYIACKTYL